MFQPIGETGEGACSAEGSTTVGASAPEMSRFMTKQRRKHQNTSASNTRVGDWAWDFLQSLHVAMRIPQRSFERERELVTRATYSEWVYNNHTDVAVVAVHDAG